MKIPLETLAPCFQGLVPSTLFTCSRAGVPNVTMISHVDYVDARHVALSFQFFNKSRRNIAENPQALVRVYDPDTMQIYALRLRYVRSETEGSTFESMRLRIEAIASYSGLKGIFRLRAADIYEVESVTAAADETGAAGVASASRRPTNPASVPFTMKALQELSDRILRATTLECLLESTLETLEKLFGFGNSMILLQGDQPDRLVTLASRGYPEHGVGSEVCIGEGIIGVVAEARKPIRISGLLRDMLYAYAVRRRARESGLQVEDERSIPLPGLPDPASQLGIPLLARDELIGVLCIESEVPYRFHEEDKTYLELLGGYLALAIQNAMLHERADEPTESASTERRVRPSAPPRPARRVEVAYYGADECILVDGEYLVRGLPAKILWKLLRESASSGRNEFTNRQLRLDKTLSLPAYKDNLESRLILLRRRLEERCPAIRITPSGRGRFVLERGCEVGLSEMP